MMDNPGEEIFDVIRYFGNKNKIFNVHFRNIKGNKLSFTEVFPDEGSINMYEAIKAYKEVKSDIKSVLASGGKEAESLRDLINVDKYKNFNSVKNAYESDQ